MAKYKVVLHSLISPKKIYAQYISYVDHSLGRIVVFLVFNIKKHTEYIIYINIVLAVNDIRQGRHLGGAGGQLLPPDFGKVVNFCVFAHDILFFSYCAPPPPRK